ncbi:MAG: 2-oxoacid:acceptor oxidoreductase family protein [bacterium]|nr:2-oxoacid:acceptor oxidoreductase family protein [bacterium]
MNTDFIEVRWHGRGGQGAKTASQLLAEAAILDGKHIQAFPEFGPEREGAPIRAFTRISKELIKLHTGVTNPGIVVVIDPTLLISANVTNGMPDDGILIVNTEESPEDIRKKLNYKKGKVFTVDATTISLETLGIPMPNTPMVGALLAAAPIVSMEKMKNIIEEKFLKKMGQKVVDKNVQALDRAYKEVKKG